MSYAEACDIAGSLSDVYDIANVVRDAHPNGSRGESTVARFYKGAQFFGWSKEMQQHLNDPIPVEDLW